jgi:hypothetical protein
MAVVVKVIFGVPVSFSYDMLLWSEDSRLWL